MVCSWSRQFPAIPWQVAISTPTQWSMIQPKRFLFFLPCPFFCTTAMFCMKSPSYCQYFPPKVDFWNNCLNFTTGQLQFQRFLRTNRNCLRRFVSQFSDRQQHVLKLTIATWNNSVKHTKHLHAIDRSHPTRHSLLLIHPFLLNHLTRLFDPIDKPNTNETPMLVQTMSPMKLMQLTQTM